VNEETVRVNAKLTVRSDVFVDSAQRAVVPLDRKSWTCHGTARSW
jgi:hypothetical protein